MTADPTENEFGESAAPTAPERVLIWVMTRPGIEKRRRAGIDFSRAWREVEIIAASDQEVAARVAIVDREDARGVVRRTGGEAVINATGASLLYADDGLVITNTKPVKPSPAAVKVATEPPPAPVPTALRETATDLGLRPAKLPILSAAFRARIAQHATAANDKRVGSMWNRLGALVQSDYIASEAQRLRWGLVDDLPFTIAGGGIFGADPNAEPLPEVARRWAVNEDLSPAWHLLAEMLGTRFPPIPDLLGQEREDATNELADAMNPMSAAFVNFYGDDRKPVQLPRSPEEDPAIRVRQRIADAERALHEVNQRSMRVQSAWSDEREAVRRRLVFAVDAALRLKEISSVARLSLGELARDLRGIPTSPAITMLQAIDLVIGAGIMLEAPEEVPAPSELKTTMRVSIARHLNRKTIRRRAGFEFSETPIEIEVDAHQRKLIEADDGLQVLDVDYDSPYAQQARHAEKESLLAQLAEVERERQQLLSQAQDLRAALTGPPTRSTPARVTRAPKGETP